MCRVYGALFSNLMAAIGVRSSFDTKKAYLYLMREGKESLGQLCVNNSSLFCQLFSHATLPLLSILGTNILVWEIWHLVSITGNGYINRISQSHTRTFTHQTNDTHFTVARKRTLGSTPAWLPALVERRVGVECLQSKVNCLFVIIMHANDSTATTGRYMIKQEKSYLSSWKQTRLKKNLFFNFSISEL